MAADVVLFDPATIADHSTFANPMQFATGVRDVFVNGVQVLKDGAPTGEVEDFVTGFVVDDTHVWGRPVGVTVAKDGTLLFSEDGQGTIWRVSHSKRQSAN